MVQVFDAGSHRPLADASIVQTVYLDGLILVGAVLRTSAAGEATVRFPTKSTTRISLQASKDGASSSPAEWHPGTTRLTLELASATK